MKFPVLTQQDIDDAAVRIKQVIYPITWCESCQSEDYGWRLGCRCGGDIQWFWKTYDKRYLTDEDVCILPRSKNP